MKKTVRTISALLLTSILVLSAIGCGGNTVTTPPTSTTVTGDFFTRLAAAPDKYNGQTVTFDGYWFSGFEITVIAERLIPQEGWAGNYVPDGIKIWFTGSTPDNFTSTLYAQPNNPTGYPAYYGKVEVTGTMETGGKYGHMDAYKYRLNIINIKKLDWKPGNSLETQNNGLPGAAPPADSAEQSNYPDSLVNAATQTLQEININLSKTDGVYADIDLCRKMIQDLTAIRDRQADLNAINNKYHWPYDGYDSINLRKELTRQLKFEVTVFQGSLKERAEDIITALTKMERMQEAWPGILPGLPEEILKYQPITNDLFTIIWGDSIFNESLNALIFDWDPETAPY